MYNVHLIIVIIIIIIIIIIIKLACIYCTLFILCSKIKSKHHGSHVLTTKIDRGVFLASV